MASARISSVSIVEPEYEEFTVTQGPVETRRHQPRSARKGDAPSTPKNKGQMPSHKLSDKAKVYLSSLADFLEQHGGGVSEKFEQFMELITDNERIESMSGENSPLARLQNMLTPQQRDLILKPFNSVSHVTTTVFNELCDRFFVDVMGIKPTIGDATFKGNLRQMEAVLTAENVNEFQDDSKLTPMHLATRAGFTDAVVLLLEQPTLRINVRDAWNGTPFHNACAAGHEHIIQLMLNCDMHKVDLNPLNNFAQTPYDLARKNGHHEMADALRRHGAKDGDDVITDMKIREAERRKNFKAKSGVKARIADDEKEDAENDGWLGNAWATATTFIENNL